MQGDQQEGPGKGLHMSHEGLHEPVSELSDETRDMHRAITSLMEELEDYLFTEKPLSHE